MTEQKPKDSRTLKERVSNIETLLGNHLHHHDQMTRNLLYPILVGVVLSACVTIFSFVQKLCFP